MQVKKLLTDDEGVSPVIGVILMVAITVILAAVIAAFVLGIGDTEDPAPSSSLNYEAIEDPSTAAAVAVDIEHESGDTFTASDAQVNIEDSGGDSTSSGTTLDEVTDLGSDEDFGPGDTARIDDGTDASNAALDGTTSDSLTIELIWAPGGGDAQSVFSEEEFTNVDISSNGSP